MQTDLMLEGTISTSTVNTRENQVSAEHIEKIILIHKPYVTRSLLTKEVVEHQGGEGVRRVEIQRQARQRGCQDLGGRTLCIISCGSNFITYNVISWKNIKTLKNQFFAIGHSGLVIF